MKRELLDDNFKSNIVDGVSVSVTPKLGDLRIVKFRGKYTNTIKYNIEIYRRYFLFFKKWMVLTIYMDGKRRILKDIKCEIHLRSYWNRAIVYFETFEKIDTMKKL